MKLVSLLNPDLIEIGIKVKSKEEVIDLFVDKFDKYYKHRIPHESFKSAIYEREKLGGTVFDPGIAMPHGRLDNFDDLIIGICVPESPVFCDDIDVRIFIVLVTSKAGASLYIQTLQTFAKLLRDKEMFEKVTSSGNKAAFLGLLDQARIRKELLIEDIMTADPVTVERSTTVKELTDLFYAHGISYAPVLDEKGRFIGEVSMNQLLEIGIPDYADKIGNLNFLTSFSPFEQLLKNEDKISVGEIMVKPSVSIERDHAIIEVAFKMKRNKRRYIPVVEGDSVIGVVSYTDLLKKVLRS